MNLPVMSFGVVHRKVNLYAGHLRMVNVGVSIYGNRIISQSVSLWAFAALPVPLKRPRLHTPQRLTNELVATLFVSR